VRTPQAYNLKTRLPILIPIVFDSEFSGENLLKTTQKLDKKIDLEYKQKILKHLVKDCLVSIRLSKVSYFINNQVN
jgi:hypothetical protein